MLSDVAVDAPEDVGGTRRILRIRMSFATALVGRLVSALTGLAVVPITLHYLGRDRFGAWLAITSLTAILSLSDLGIGNGLVSRLAGLDEEQTKDGVSVDEVLASAVAMLLVFAAVLSGGLVVALATLDWSGLLNSTGVPDGDLVASAAAVLGVFVVAMPLSVVTNLRVARQETHVNNLCAAAAAVFSLAIVWISVRASAPMGFVVLAAASPPVLGPIINWVLLSQGGARIRLQVRLATRSTALALLRTGLLFLALQVVSTVAFSSDAFVVAQVLGPEAVTDLAVPQRLFGAVAGVLGLATVSFWPAFAEAIGQNNHDWVVRTFWRAIIYIGGGSAAVGAALTFAGPRVLELWVGESVEVDTALLLGLWAWLILAAVGNVVAMLLAAASIIRFQVVVGAAMAVVNIALSIVLAEKVGVSGVVWGSVLSYGSLAILPCFLIARHVLRADEPHPRLGGLAP